MAENYIKDLLGFEDVFFDTGGVNSSFNRKISTGAAMSIKGLNSSHIPLLLTTRTLALYDQGVLDAEEVDGALTQICASLASIHKFQNEEILDAIQSAGSGAVISSEERAKLNRILDTGSGNIITNAERNKLEEIVGLTQAQIDQLTDIDSILPIGSVIGFPTSAPPIGYFHCNGAAVSRATYSNLFSAIGTTYGVGDNTTTFNLPDYRGQFLRGWDNGRGLDPNAVDRLDRGDATTGDNIGTTQPDEFKEHKHRLYAQGTGNDPNIIDLDSGATGQMRDESFQGEALMEETGGDETRPTNVNIMWCMRHGVI